MRKQAAFLLLVSNQFASDSGFINYNSWNEIWADEPGLLIQARYRRRQRDQPWRQVLKIKASEPVHQVPWSSKYSTEHRPKTKLWVQLSVANMPFVHFVQQEREDYEVVIEDGKFLYKKSGRILDTSCGPRDAKWIFVLSTSKCLYVGQVNIHILSC